MTAWNEKHLNNGWKIQHFTNDDSIVDSLILDSYNDSEWISAAVPGDVHTAMLRQGIIEDPYYSTNDRTSRWMEEKIWWYRTSFDAPDDQVDGEIWLTFDGLDTLAEIYLNGEKIGTSDNMFVPLSIRVTHRIKRQRNVLAVRFDSVIQYARKKDVSKFWAKVNYERIWVRKCAASYSWDWGPRLITTGIWKDVKLEALRPSKIEHLYGRTLSLTEHVAMLNVEVETAKAVNGTDLTVLLTLKEPGSQREVYSGVLKIQDGLGQTQFRVDDPKLWWTYDHGTPYLYELTATLKQGDVEIHSLTDEIGIRTIEVKQRSEDGGPRFTFLLNGREIYAKGANWIPADALLSSIPDERYVDLIRLSREANMNMLRVWGGGIYEKEIFYRECSRQGLLVWQDFMFSCSELPDYDPDFMANVRREVVHNVKVLRNHTCIAIWAGNNENQAIHSEKMYFRSDYRFYGEKIFHELMPEVLEALDPSRLYWPSSPWGGNDPNSYDEGDCHNWAVWHGDVYPRRYGEKPKSDLSPYGISYRRYADDTSKFSSEFGIHGSTVKETLRRNIPETELYYGNFELDYRNKDYEPEKGLMTMEHYSGLPHNLDEYIDYSMLCQAEGIKYGVEHYRRRKPENSGALIWQLNDNWPGISWSLIDYYLFPKAAYYYARRFFHPILLSVKEEADGGVSVWVTNDTYEAYEDTVTVGVKDIFGYNYYDSKLNVQVRGNVSQLLVAYSAAEIEWRMGVINRRNVMLYVRSEREDVYDNHYFFADHKDLRLSPCRLSCKFEENDGQLEIEVSTDVLARFVKLECPVDGTYFTDNYFNLLPGERKRVTAVNRRQSITAGDISLGALNGRTIE